MKPIIKKHKLKIMNELSKKLERLQVYRELLKVDKSLKRIQRDYDMTPAELLEFIREIEIKLLTNVDLNRDNKVFCYTLDRVYQNEPCDAQHF